MSTASTDRLLAMGNNQVLMSGLYGCDDPFIVLLESKRCKQIFVYGAFIFLPGLLFLENQTLPWKQ